MSQLLVAQRALTVPGWAKDALWRSARAVPSLDLRFADSKSLVDATTGSNLVTFTRASSGTFVDSAGVLQTAVTDAPRFDHNPTTGESLGLLVEEQRTNFLLQSEDLLTTWTANDGLVRTANQIVSPAGSVTADRLASGGTQIGYLEQPNASSNQFVSGTTYTYSVYLKKANTSTCLTLLFGATFNSGGGNPVATWNLDTGVPAFTNGATGSMTAVGDGWYRCVMTDTATQTHTQSQQWLRMPSTSGDVYAWGAQLEAGAFPTSYIPTTTAAVTRSADVASITGSAFSSWYRQDEGSFFCSTFAPKGVIVYGTGDTFDNTQYITVSSSNNVSIRSGGAGSASLTAPISTTALTNIAHGYAADNFAAVSNGGAISTDTSGAVPLAQVRLKLGSSAWDSGGLNNLNGTIRRLTYWPTRLSNSTLQSITL